MLIQPDKNELGDKRLDVSESITKLKEENKKLYQARTRIPDQEALANEEAARGQMLPSGEFIRLLQRVCPKLIIEKGGYPNAVALRHYVDGKKVYVGGFILGEVPEYTSVIEDEMGGVIGMKRGWREVLTSLLKANLVNLEAVKREFNVATSNTVHGQFWASQLRGRN